MELSLPVLSTICIGLTQSLDRFRYFSAVKCEILGRDYVQLKYTDSFLTKQMLLWFYLSTCYRSGRVKTFTNSLPPKNVNGLCFKSSFGITSWKNPTVYSSANNNSTPLFHLQANYKRKLLFFFNWTWGLKISFCHIGLPLLPSQKFRMKA